MDPGEASELQRDLGRLEGTVAAQAQRITELDNRLKHSSKITMDKLDRIIAYQEQHKGGRKTLFVVATFGAPLLGALAGWLTNLFLHPSH